MFELAQCANAILQIVKNAAVNVTVLDLFGIQNFPTESGKL